MAHLETEEKTLTNHHEGVIPAMTVEKIGRGLFLNLESPEKIKTQGAKGAKLYVFVSKESNRRGAAKLVRFSIFYSQSKGVRS